MMMCQFKIVTTLTEYGYDVISEQKFLFKRQINTIRYFKSGYTVAFRSTESIYFSQCAPNTSLFCLQNVCFVAYVCTTCLVRRKQISKCLECLTQTDSVVCWLDTLIQNIRFVPNPHLGLFTPAVYVSQSIQVLV